MLPGLLLDTSPGTVLALPCAALLQLLLLLLLLLALLLLPLPAYHPGLR